MLADVEDRDSDSDGDEFTRQEEAVLVERVLRHQAGIDPRHLGQVLDLAAVGIVNSAWRNSPVEDWHAADGPLTDGAMLRINAHTTWRIREIMRRWRAETGLTPDAPTATLDDLDVEATDRLAVRIWRWLVNPGRRLPIGTTLAELAGAGLDEFSDHVDATLGLFAATAEHRGGRYASWRASAHGGLACPHWWGTPTWPQLVDTLLWVLDDPVHAHWGADGDRRARLPPEPAQVMDRTGLRRVLMYRPWSLDPESADWLVWAGIGYLRAPRPALPAEIDDASATDFV
ncbi:hypothetical protein [Pseudonocardia nigra]|uniref:hypothetical protein n=1 Tax=Pseudonocardia nigra TaxID=1921578 RepID=UPI001C5EF40E|nr:hypothetical protein [Pseudonocardia nigra]